MTKVLILGNYGAKNFGDELVLRGILKIIEDKNYDIRVLSSDPQETAALHNVKSGWVFPTGLRSLLRLSIFQTLKYYWETDEVLFGGGTLFTDEESKTIWISGLQILPAILMRKKIVCFRQGVGQIKHKRIVKWIFDRLSEITVRDHASQDELLKIGVSKTIKVENDPVFSLPKKQADGDELLVSLRDWPGLDPDFEQKFTQFLEWTGMPVHVMVFGAEDFRLSSRIAKRTNAKLTRVTMKNYEEIFVSGKIALNFRLHASVLSIMFGMPCIGFAYEDKIRNLFEENQLEKYIMGIENIEVAKLKKLFEDLTKDASVLG
ncbi:hypothetical protein GW777_07365 [Candidatus Peregrinibacteria bacterium]|nr:hypothetical protein [Candidatus Peregrinibacteria bacterium]PIX79323.1 MAG: hypothetical protein COZ35_03700 [Candidatus Peregrinibacteria bacterium CG_4_10_14_3_um_filter_44_21]PJB88814.1 MAG: hypothetical protein CO082_03250 [Candidatus Peregrinibacteria bacterium CG_4_9_14_0_8_um_filter_44_15]